MSKVHHGKHYRKGKTMIKATKKNITHRSENGDLTIKLEAYNLWIMINDCGDGFVNVICGINLPGLNDQMLDGLREFEPTENELLRKTDKRNLFHRNGTFKGFTVPLWIENKAVDATQDSDYYRYVFSRFADAHRGAYRDLDALKVEYCKWVDDNYPYFTLADREACFEYGDWYCMYAHNTSDGMYKVF